MKNDYLFDNYISSQMDYLKSNGKDLDLMLLGKQKRFRNNILPLFPNDLNSIVLEIGPGRGELLLLLKDVGYNNVSAIDLSSEVVDFCNKVVPESTALVTDAYKYFTSQSTNSIDVVVSSHVLEHIKKVDLIPLLAEIKRVLKPNGFVIAEVPNSDSPVFNITRYGDYTHEVVFSERSLNQVFNVANYSSIKVYPATVPVDSLPRLIQITLQLLIFVSYKLICKSLDVYVPKYLHGSIIAKAVK